MFFSDWQNYHFSFAAHIHINIKKDSNNNNLPSYYLSTHFLLLLLITYPHVSFVNTAGLQHQQLPTTLFFLPDLLVCWQFLPLNLQLSYDDALVETKYIWRFTITRSSCLASLDLIKMFYDKKNKPYILYTLSLALPFVSFTQFCRQEREKDLICMYICTYISIIFVW